MTDLLLDLVSTLEYRPQNTVYCCPDCGSFLDAPRIDPSTGHLGRKCVACREWMPVEPQLATEPY